MGLIYQSRYQHMALKQMAQKSTSEVEERSGLELFYTFVQRFIMIRFEMFKLLRVKERNFWCQKVSFFHAGKSRFGHFVGSN